MGLPASRLRRIAGPAAPWLAAGAVFVISITVPLRPQGGDVSGGTLGAATLACSHGFDLRSVQWIGERDPRRPLPYYLRRDRDGRVSSTFGPGPALLGWPADATLEPGSRLTTDTLEARGRIAAAAAVSLSVLLLALALRARRGVAASAGFALVAGLSYAGSATLAQGLWQQSAALPWIAALLVAIGHGPARPRLAAVTGPGLVVAAGFLRPAETPLLASMGIALVLAVGLGPEVRGAWIGGVVAALLVALPFVAWNVWYADGPLPMQQWAVNADQADRGAVLDFAPGHVATALVGLLVGPARGLLFHAPLAWMSVGSLRGARREDRALAGGLLAQLVVVAAFHKWWGGVCFGPRLLAVAVWVAVFVVGAMPSGSAGRRGATYALALLTVLVGLLGTFRYDPRTYELPMDFDRHPERAGLGSASPLPALLRTPLPDEPLRGLVYGPFVYCEGGHTLGILPESRHLPEPVPSPPP